MGTEAATAVAVAAALVAVAAELFGNSGGNSVVSGSACGVASGGGVVAGNG